MISHRRFSPGCPHGYNIESFDLERRIRLILLSQTQQILLFQEKIIYLKYNFINMLSMAPEFDTLLE